MIWVLLIYAWSVSSDAGSGIATAEFTSKENCEAAAQAAAKEFDGVYSKTYHVCVVK